MTSSHLMGSQAEKVVLTGHVCSDATSVNIHSKYFASDQDDDDQPTATKRKQSLSLWHSIDLMVSLSLSLSLH